MKRIVKIDNNTAEEQVYFYDEEQNEVITSRARYTRQVVEQELEKLTAIKSEMDK